MTLRKTNALIAMFVYTICMQFYRVDITYIVVLSTKLENHDRLLLLKYYLNTNTAS